jgi:hypothetical protein
MRNRTSLAFAVFAPRTWAGLAAALLAASPLAAAQPAPAGVEQPASDRERARQRYDEGMTAYQAGDYAAARAALEESYRLFASLRTLFSLGLCRQAAGDDPGAIHAFEQYLREAGAEAPADLRSQAEERLASLRAGVGRLRVQADIDGAEIRIDGEVVGTTPLAEPLAAGPGWHLVEAVRAGYDSAPQRVQIAAGSETSVSLTLAPAAVAPLPPPPPPAGDSALSTDGYLVRYGPPEGVSEVEWYGISDAAYRNYIYSTGRRMPLPNWILEQNRENTDYLWAEVIAGTQGAAWLAAGTFVYLFYEKDMNYDPLPWMSFFEWLLGGALIVRAVGVAIVEALDIGHVEVAHPERLLAVPAGFPTAGDSPSTATLDLPERPAWSASFGPGGLLLRF